jgi:hypothetical protein
MPLERKIRPPYGPGGSTMDSDLDGMMERAKSRVRARREKPFNPEYVEHPFGVVDFLRFKTSTESNTALMDMATRYAWRGVIRKLSGKKRGARPGRKRGRKF